LHAQDRIVVKEEVLRSALTRLIGDESIGMVRVLHEGASVVGYAVVSYGYSLEFHGRNALLDELFIAEGYRGKGFGRRAVEFLLEECAKAGVHAVHLEVDRSNRPAQELYRKYGFVDHDRYLMTKRLHT
jgi:ribosomal protein S18 acetylase RimI-like enzyme